MFCKDKCLGLGPAPRPSDLQERSTSILYPLYVIFLTEEPPLSFPFCELSALSMLTHGLRVSSAWL